MSETQATPTPPPKPPKHERLTRAEERALNALEKKADPENPDLGRDFILDKLLHVPNLSPDEERLLALISDPARERVGLAALCTEAGFSVARFLKFLQRASGAQALLASMDRVYAKGAEVAGDAMEMARIRTFTCIPCAGAGEITKGENTVRCEGCGGLGTVTREPSVQQQKLALQLLGMLAQGSGVSVNVSQNANPVVSSSSSSTSALVDGKFVDSLRANSDAAIRAARGLKAGSVAVLSPGKVIEASFVKGGDASDNHMPEVREREDIRLPRVSLSVAAPQLVDPPVTPQLGRSVVPPLGIPAGVRRPPPS